MACSVWARVSTLRSKLFMPRKFNYIFQERPFHHQHVPIMRAMKKRRKLAGPPPNYLRSAWISWNRQAELYGFAKRLNEEFNEETLDTAFTHLSYIEREETKRRNLGIPESDVPLNLLDNSQLIREGENVMTTYIKGYLRYVYPLFPEEGICTVHDYLMSTDVLSHVSFNIGSEDLILCAEHPPEKHTLMETLKAIIGAIQRDQNTCKAEQFIQDFIITQLVGKDINVIWDIPNPMAVLASILKTEGREPPEPRLLWKAGPNTIFAVYHVGIYSSKLLLGQGPGETVSTAVNIAARDSLNRMFAVNCNHISLPFGATGQNLQTQKDAENVYLSKWTSRSLEKIKTCNIAFNDV